MCGDCPTCQRLADRDGRAACNRPTAMAVQRLASGITTCCADAPFGLQTRRSASTAACRLCFRAVARLQLTRPPACHASWPADAPRRKRRRMRGTPADDEAEDSDLQSAQYHSNHSLQVGFECCLCFDWVCFDWVWEGRR